MKPVVQRSLSRAHTALRESRCHPPAPRRLPALLRMLVLVLTLALAAALGSGVAGAQTLSDAFTGRAVLTAPSGQVDGDNLGAGLEPGEPQHARKPGGRSVWISWLAPTNGIATFWTDGSTIDTLMAAYYFNSTNDVRLDQLREETSNDDDPTRPGSHASLIQFGARAGRRYEIAIDGYRGATGDLRLRWDFLTATSPPPVIVSLPNDRSAREGDAVTLAVDMQVSPSVSLQWRFNGNSFGAQGASLTLPSLRPDQVGRYTLRIDLGDVRFETPPIELQINSDAQTNALARDKLFDALESGLTPSGDDGGFRPAGDGLALASVGVSRGFNGTQIFNTTYATPDPNEPAHCGLAGGASYWYAYSPPADGTLTLDTIGSTYDTFIAVYTYDPPLLSYAGLLALNCDNNSAGTNGAARLEIAAPKSRQFLVVVDGINGARGIAQLNYRLETNRPPVPPTLLQAPAPRHAAVGEDVLLQAGVIGSPPLHFLWSRDGTTLSGATNHDLALDGVTAAQSGTYSVRVSSHVGLPISVMLPLQVLTPPRLDSFKFLQDGSLAAQFIGLPGQRYFIETTDDLATPWRLFGTPRDGDGTTIFVTNSPTAAIQFYRVRVE